MIVDHQNCNEDGDNNSDWLSDNLPYKAASNVALITHFNVMTRNIYSNRPFLSEKAKKLQLI